MMRIKWLGIDTYYMASVLIYQVDMKLPQSPKANLAQLWPEIVDMYQELQIQTRFSCLALNMIRANQNPFPCLKGKASEVKWLLPALLRVTSKYLVDSDFERLMQQGLLQSWAIDQCLEANRSHPRSTWGRGYRVQLQIPS